MVFNCNKIFFGVLLRVYKLLKTAINKVFSHLGIKEKLKKDFIFNRKSIPQRVSGVILSKSNVVVVLKRYKKDFFYSKKLLQCFAQLVDNLH